MKRLKFGLAAMSGVEFGSWPSGHGKVRLMWFWTGAWTPRYRFYRETLNQAGAFYCKQISWLCFRLMWGLNAAGQK